jgi:hypothetical protein
VIAIDDGRQGNKINTANPGWTIEKIFDHFLRERRTHQRAPIIPAASRC